MKERYHQTVPIVDHYQTKIFAASERIDHAIETALNLIKQRERKDVLLVSFQPVLLDGYDLLTVIAEPS